MQCQCLMMLHLERIPIFKIASNCVRGVYLAFEMVDREHQWQCCPDCKHRWQRRESPTSAAAIWNANSYAQWELSVALM